MIAWYLCEYKRKIGAIRPTRYCAMDDFTKQIYPSGSWSETEIDGNKAIVKVNTTVEIHKDLRKVFKKYKDKIQAISEYTTTRKKPRYDEATDTIVCDGIDVPTKSLDKVDKEIK